MHEVLLCELHEEVGIELDVEVEVARGLLGRGNVQVQGLVEQFDRLVGVAPLAPLYQRLYEDQLGHLLCVAARVSLVDLVYELQLLFRIVQLVLSYAAIDHANEWSEVALIESGCLLIDGVCACVIPLNLLLVGNFGVKE